MGPDFTVITDFMAGQVPTVIAAILAAGVALLVFQLTVHGVRKIKAAVYWAVDSAWASGAISRSTRDRIQERVRF